MTNDSKAGKTVDKVDKVDKANAEWVERVRKAATRVVVYHPDGSVGRREVYDPDAVVTVDGVTVRAGDVV